MPIYALKAFLLKSIFTSLIISDVLRQGKTVHVQAFKHEDKTTPKLEKLANTLKAKRLKICRTI